METWGRRKKERENKRERDFGVQVSELSDYMLKSLIMGLDDPSRRYNCAVRILNNYDWNQIGKTLYHRCYNIRRGYRSDHDQIRYRIVRGKPGRLSREEGSPDGYPGRSKLSMII